MTEKIQLAKWLARISIVISHIGIAVLAARHYVAGNTEGAIEGLELLAVLMLVEAIGALVIAYGLVAVVVYRKRSGIKQYVSGGEAGE